jgi:hypothetical protein
LDFRFSQYEIGPNFNPKSKIKNQKSRVSHHYRSNRPAFSYRFNPHFLAATAFCCYGGRGDGGGAV